MLFCPTFFACLSLSILLSFWVSKILLVLRNRFYIVLKVLRLGKCLHVLCASLSAFSVYQSPLKLREKWLYMLRKMELCSIFSFSLTFTPTNGGQLEHFWGRSQMPLWVIRPEWRCRARDLHWQWCCIAVMGVPKSCCKPSPQGKSAAGGCGELLLHPPRGR